RVPPYLPATVAPVHLDPSGRISMLQVPVHQHLQERAERAGSLAPDMARGERLAPLPAGQGFEKGTVVEERAPLVVVTPLRRSKADDSALLFAEDNELIGGWCRLAPLSSIDPLLEDGTVTEASAGRPDRRGWT